jgi:hypothetical protein
MKYKRPAPATSHQLGMPANICCSNHDVVSVVVAAATVLGSGIVPELGVTITGTIAGRAVSPVVEVGPVLAGGVAAGEVITGTGACTMGMIGVGKVGG